jgi:hypothetical protein
MATQHNLVTDISTLTRVPNKTLNELIHKVNLCIGSIIAEAKNKGEQAVIINIGLGTLSIDLITMQSKFIPSKDLKTTIKQGVTTGIDPLECALEQALVEKLIHFCDEVL